MVTVYVSGTTVTVPIPLVFEVVTTVAPTEDVNVIVALATP
jgi:hypothetical protein